MSESPHEQRLDEIHKLRETGESLIERVEDVAASIRYLTNNLLDDQFYPEMATSVRQLAHQVGQLVSLSTAAESDKVLHPVAKQLEYGAQQCDSCLSLDIDSTAEPSRTETLQTAHAELPLSLDARLSLLVSGLQQEASQLVEHEKLGEESAWQWWENRITSIHAALGALERLEEESVGIGVDLLPIIERLGGIPERLLPDQWPEDLVEAYIACGDEEEEAPQSDAETNGSEGGNGIGDNGRNGAQQQTLFSLPSTGTVAPGTTTESLPTEPVTAESREPRSQEGMDSLDHLHRPYTIDDYRAFCERRDDEQLSADQWREEYARLRNDREAFVEHLLRNCNAPELKTLAMRAGCLSANRQKKTENAAAVYRACLSGFVLGNSVQFNPMEETYEEAVHRIVSRLTDEDFAKHYAKQQQRLEEHQKAVENPETLTEFCTFVREKGEDALADEQHLRRDRLYADMSRQTRSQRQSGSVEQFQSDSLDGLEFSIKEGFHEKRQCPLWIVQISTRVERATFVELKTKAKQLGGWYSSFKKDDAGFQFLTGDAADKFVGLKDRDADRTEELEERRIRKLGSTAERFAAMAERLTEQAETTLAADDGKLKNTVRRAEMAASTRARAREDLATAKTLQSLVSQLKDGETTYLDGVRYAVQIDALGSILRRARWSHIRHVMQSKHSELSNYEQNLKQDELEQRQADASDIRFAEYPKPYLYRGNLERAFAQLQSTKGVKQVTAKMQKLVKQTPKGQEYVEFYRDHEIELLEDFFGRAKAAGYNCYWFEHCLEDHKRLRAANIHDGHELRAALAELLPHLSPAEGDDPITQAIDSLRGKKLPGFFPTPKPIILQMLDLADIQGDDRVLEPSAGMGDILDAIRQRHPDIDLKAIEQNHTLADVLAAKRYDELTTFGDFLEHQGPYDKIVMNPPFEQGADIDHVRHAYDLLSVGGRLVSVMCEGPFFRSDAKSKEFRQWLDKRDAEAEQLPDDAFQGVEAFRQTGVKARLVTIDKHE